MNGGGQYHSFGAFFYTDGSLFLENSKCHHYSFKNHREKMLHRMMPQLGVTYPIDYSYILSKREEHEEHSPTLCSTLVALVLEIDVFSDSNSLVGWLYKY